MSQRKIIHFDMDCFYAAVEEKFQPRLRGHPVGVGSPEGRGGVLTTANYAARAFGVKSSMTTAQALKLCPSLILVSPDFSKYKAESKSVRAILERYCTRIEPLGLDEAYVDVTDSPFEQGSATRLAQRIRKEIKEELGLTASAGVAPNKFLAKIASDLRKPDGLTVIRPSQVAEFVKTLGVEKIWGVGKVTATKMHRLGLRTCGDLQAWSLAQLVESFGSWGPQLYDFARGIDHRAVQSDRARKSLSVEETYENDLRSRAEATAALRPVYRDFIERLQLYRGRGEEERTHSIRSAVVKVKFSDFRAKGREKKWTRLEPPPIGFFEELLNEALDGETKAIRLLGLGVRFIESEVDAKSAAAKLTANGLQLRF